MYRLHQLTPRKLSIAACFIVLPLLLNFGCGQDEDAASDPVAEISYFNYRGAGQAAGAELEAATEGSPQWQQAIFLLATARQHSLPVSQSNIEEATALYQKLIEVSPDSPYAPHAKLALGRIAALRDYNDDKPDLDAARRHYQELLERWPDHKQLHGLVTLRIAQTYIQNLDDAEQVNVGIRMLDDWLTAKQTEADQAGRRLTEVEPLAPVMLQFLGGLHHFHPTNVFISRPWHDNRKALDYLLRAVDTGLVQKGQEGAVYWQISQIAMHFRQLASDEATRADYTDEERQFFEQTAISFYRKIILDTPNSGKAYRAWLELQYRLGQEVAPFDQMIAEGMRSRMPHADIEPPSRDEPPRSELDHPPVESSPEIMDPERADQ